MATSVSDAEEGMFCAFLLWLVAYSFFPFFFYFLFFINFFCIISFFFL